MIAADLWTAITTGDVETVRALLDAGTEIYEDEMGGPSALHDAAGFNQTEILEILLSRRASIESRNVFGNTAVHIAAESGSTAALVALLKHRADVNQRDRWSATPLHVAAIRGQVGAAQLLLEGSADPTLRLDYSRLSQQELSIFPSWLGLDGMTPLQLAERRGQTQMVSVLTECPLVLTVRAQSLGGGLGFKISCGTMSGREVAALGWPANANASGLAAALRAALQKQSPRPHRIVRFVLPTPAGGFLTEETDMAQLGATTSPDNVDHFQATKETLQQAWLEVEEAQLALARERQQLKEEWALLQVTREKEELRLRRWRCLRSIGDCALVAVTTALLLRVLHRRQGTP